MFGKMKCSIQLPTSSPSLLYLQVIMWTWKIMKTLLYILFLFVDVNCSILNGFFLISDAGMWLITYFLNFDAVQINNDQWLICKLNHSAPLWIFSMEAFGLESLDCISRAGLALVEHSHVALLIENQTQHSATIWVLDSVTFTVLADVGICSKVEGVGEECSLRNAVAQGIH